MTTTETSSHLSRALLAGSADGMASLPGLLADGMAAAPERPLATQRRGPAPAGRPAEVLATATQAIGSTGLPVAGIGAEAALRRIASVLLAQGLDLSHPWAAAHLQPPPLSVAAAADALASASNASLDTYDSGPSAIAVERWLIAALAGLAGLGPRADGVLTPGGSLSNLLGLLLARDAAAARRGVDSRQHGVAALPGPVVFCSEVAHFSVHRACAALGLGEAAVRPVPVDARRRMRPDALRAMLTEVGPPAGERSDQTPVAVVATAGATDFGSVDPLPELAEVAADHGLWLHVDAAYGFGALFSEALADRMAGIELADSITLDLHKLGWQPAPASALLVCDPAAFSALDRQVAYLNPVDDTDAGYDGLLGRSLQTTRRPDAVKMAATLLAYGRRGLGEMVDACHGLARHAEQRIRSEPALELVADAELTTVVFRYRSARRVPAALGGAADTAASAAAEQLLDEHEDRVNGTLRRRLLESGTALIGRTSCRLDGPGSPERVCLKLTLLNPSATPDDIDGLLDVVLHAGRAEDQTE